MKANVPEKIYCTPAEGGLYFTTTKPEPPFAEGVEYTRTDAFIEKAKKWFIEHTNIPQEVETNADGEPLADSYVKYAQSRFNAAIEIFEDFRNYMKGE